MGSPFKYKYQQDNIVNQFKITLVETFLSSSLSEFLKFFFDIHKPLLEPVIKVIFGFDLDLTHYLMTLQAVQVFSRCFP